MLVGSSRGWRRPRFLNAIISDAGILEQGEVVVIPHGGSRSGGGEANELLHGLNHGGVQGCSGHQFGGGST